MKNTELRIGNYFKAEPYSFDVLQVQALGSEFVIIEDGSLFYKNIKPIPITEKWLTKLGFEKQKGIYRSFYQSNDNNYLSICFDQDRYYFMDVNEDPSFSGFKYVHQLQNLYFALTGTELSYGKETK